MNLVILAGRSTRDPRVRYMENGQCVADLNLAVDRRYKKEGSPSADFFSCIAFGKTAESIEKFVQKGTKIILTGTIQNDNYERDHVKHYEQKIIIDSWEFAESKKAAGGEDQKADQDGSDGFMNIPTGIDDEMPFV